MSSIYKKGKYGYYYYQAYVYNPESKKRDKRIFHALRTKDIVEAKTKQHELDTQYENQIYINSNVIKRPVNFNPKSTIAIIVATIGITISVSNLFKKNTVKQNISVLTASKKSRILDKKNDDALVKPINFNHIDSVKEKKSEIITTKPKLVESTVNIPKYTIERVDRLSSAFEQGKVYVTIDKLSSIESQRLLCKELVKRYSEFSNILICLYTNNRPGKNLALGKGKTVSVEEKKQSWLAMYTYNQVEGEYFDNNPSGYLGNY